MHKEYVARVCVVARARLLHAAREGLRATAEHSKHARLKPSQIMMTSHPQPKAVQGRHIYGLCLFDDDTQPKYDHTLMVDNVTIVGAADRQAVAPLQANNS